MRHLKDLFFLYKLNFFISFIGFISLLGPSRSIELHKRSAIESNELSGYSILSVFISECALRATCFLLIAGFIEYILGEGIFELYRLDYFFGILLFASSLHLTSYLLGVIIISPLNWRYGMIIYRLGRNLAYANIPAVIAVYISVLSNHYHEISIPKDSNFYHLFFSIYCLLAVAGILEAFFKSNKAVCLGDINR